MAKKDKKSTGSKKKWFFGLGFLIVVAIVLIVVCTLPVDNNKVISALNNVTTTSVVQNEENKANFVSLQTEITGNATVKYYADEIEDVYMIMESVDQISNYYNDYYIYAKDNNVRRANASAILSSANQIKNIQKHMNTSLSDSVAKKGSSFLQNNWIEFRAHFASQLREYAKMFASLNKVYQGSMGGSLVNNKASTQILNCVDDYMAFLTENFDALVEHDIEGSLQSSYAYDLSAQVEAFSKFTNKYLANRESIQNYSFDATIQTKFALVSQFEEALQETSFRPVIESASYQGGLLKASFTKTSSHQDAPSILANVNLFVVGGL